MFLRCRLVLISLCIAPQCIAIDSVKLAVENSWPPYSNQKGNGISKEIIKAAYGALNIKTEFVVVPYARALKMAENGQVDGAFNVTKQQSTLDKFNFGQRPILQATASFYYPKTSNLDFQRVDDIPNDTVVGVILGYEYGNDYDSAKGRFREVRVSNQTQLIGLLLNKRIDLAIMFDEVAKAKLSALALDFDAIKKGQINHKSDIYVAFSKSKDTTQAMQLLDRGLAIIAK